MSHVKDSAVACIKTCVLHITRVGVALVPQGWQHGLTVRLGLRPRQMRALDRRALPSVRRVLSGSHCRVCIAQLTFWRDAVVLAGDAPGAATALRQRVKPLTSGENEPRPGVVVKRRDRRDHTNTNTNGFQAKHINSSLA